MIMLKIAGTFHGAMDRLVRSTEIVVMSRSSPGDAARRIATKYKMEAKTYGISIWKLLNSWENPNSAL